jgi:hypothetical protein
VIQGREKRGKKKVNKNSKIKWQVKLGVLLVILSFIVYFINYAIFKDFHHILTFFLEDLAFIPIEVLVVTLLIDKVIEKREKEHMMQKLNMVIGVFFTEIGTSIMHTCIKLDPNVDKIRAAMIIKEECDKADYNNLLKILKNYEYSISIEGVDVHEVKEFLTSKREFLIRLLENPNLLEHETFAELLNAVFHVEEELLARDLDKLSKEDEDHIEGDIVRVYKYIVYEWVQYMRHLQGKYPYLFKTALYNNPFNLRK